MVATRGKNITYASKHMSSLWNPFTYKNTEPKYPDGLAQWSIGQKFNNHCIVEGEDILIILYPGLVNYMLVYGKSISYTGESPFASVDGVTVPTDICRGFSVTADRGDIFNPQFTTKNKMDDVPSADPKKRFVLQPRNKVSSWRPVSIACKIQPLNNYNSIECGKDGWWEAVRQNPPINMYDWGVHGLKERLQLLAGGREPVQNAGGDYVRAFDRMFDLGQGKISPELREESPWDKYGDKKPAFINAAGMLEPVPATLESLKGSEEWTLQPTYSRGAIRDLQCWTFQLNNVMKDNEFIDIRGVSTITDLEEDEYIYNDTEAHVWAFELDGPPRRYIYSGAITSADRELVHYKLQSLGEGTTSLHTHLQAIEGFDCLKSDAFDTIVIKIHGRENSRFLIQSVGNYEYLAYNDTILQEYMTTSYASTEELAEYLYIRNNDYKTPNHNYFRDKVKF